jgi:hypothetical protein
MPRKDTGNTCLQSILCESTCFPFLVLFISSFEFMSPSGHFFSITYKVYPTNRLSGNVCIVPLYMKDSSAGHGILVNSFSLPSQYFEYVIPPWPPLFQMKSQPSTRSLLPYNFSFTVVKLFSFSLVSEVWLLDVKVWIILWLFYFRFVELFRYVGKCFSSNLESFHHCFFESTPCLSLSFLLLWESHYYIC